MQVIQHNFYRQPLRHCQRGVLLLEAMVYIMLVGLLATWGASYTLKQIEDHGMESTAVYMTILKSGLEKYNATNRDELSVGLSVRQPACGPTPRIGVQVVNPLAPTVAELVAGFCISAPGFPSTTPQNQNVAIKIELQGCPGVSCRVFATAYTTTPLQTRGNDRYDLVAAYLQASNGSGAASQPGDEGFLRSPYMRTANPVLGPGGAPAGAVIAIGTYFDEGIYANFVKLNDVRPINLNNTLTVAGDITGRSNVGTSDSIAACFRAALTNGGQVIARASDCLARVVLDGNTGNVTSFDATGRNAAGIRYSGNASTLYADNLQNNNNTAGITANGQVYGASANITGNVNAGSVTAGSATINGPLQVNGAATITGAVTGGSFANAANTAGIRADGTVYGIFGNFGSIVINNSATPGQACAPENAAVWGNVGGVDILMRCVGGVWAPATGSQIGTVGGTCSVNGATGITAGGVSLICSNGYWTTLQSNISRYVMVGSYFVAHLDTVSKPTCASVGPTPGLALIALIGQAEGSPDGSFTRRAVDNGASWTVLLTQSDGTTALLGNPGARSLAQVYCYY